MLEAFVHRVRNGLSSLNGSKGAPSNPLNLSNLSNLPEGYEEMTDQELAVWYNDNVIYPDKVRLNCYYYRHYLDIPADSRPPIPVILGHLS